MRIASRVLLPHQPWAGLMPWRCLGALLVLWLLGPWAASAAQPLTLRDDQPSVEAWPAVAILPDPSREQTVQEAMARREAYRTGQDEP